MDTLTKSQAGSNQLTRCLVTFRGVFFSCGKQGLLLALALKSIFFAIAFNDISELYIPSSIYPSNSVYRVSFTGAQ